MTLDDLNRMEEKFGAWAQNVKIWAFTILACVVFIFIPLFLAFDYFGPLIPIPDDPGQITKLRIDRLQAAVTSRFPSSEVRIQGRFARGVYLWIDRKVFEDTPVPDRAEALTSLAKTWCRKLGVRDNEALGSVTIRDIRTDEVLGWKFCFPLTLNRRGRIEPD